MKLISNKKSYLWIILIFLAFFLGAFFLLSQTTGLLCPDGFYHIKMTEIIGQNFPGILKNFPWLNFTILKDGFVDHHFLFHILAIPLIVISPLWGMKIFISFLIMLFFSFFYFLLKRIKIKYPEFWLLLFISSAGFLFRIFLLRAILLSLIFIFLIFYFLKEKKYLWLFILSFIFVWSYNAFPLIFIIAFIFFIAGFYKNKVKNWKILSYPFLGIIFGIIINPYFPKNLEFFKTHILEIPFLNGLYNVSVGAEWYPADFNYLLANNFLIWLVFCGIIFVILYRWKNFKAFKEKISVEGLSAIIISIFFFFLMVRSQRFVEYWVPFTVLAGALVVRDFRLDKKFLNSTKLLYRAKKWLLILPSIILLIPIFWIIFNSWNGLYLSLKNTSPYDRYKPATEWLKTNTPEKSIVFNVSWDDFPELFYWDDKNYYIVGMDPTFMYEYDKNLYEKWQAVGSGEDKKPSETIKKYFDSEIIFTNKFKNPSFIKNASADLGLEKTYEDSWSVIYKIK